MENQRIETLKKRYAKIKEIAKQVENNEVLEDIENTDVKVCRIPTEDEIKRGEICETCQDN